MAQGYNFSSHQNRWLHSWRQEWQLNISVSMFHKKLSLTCEILNYLLSNLKIRWCVIYICICAYITSMLRRNTGFIVVLIMERYYVPNESAGGTLFEHQTWSNSAFWKTPQLVPELLKFLSQGVVVLKLAHSTRKPLDFCQCHLIRL